MGSRCRQQFTSPATRCACAVVTLLALVGCRTVPPPPESNQTAQPKPYVYREIAGRKLAAYVFHPDSTATRGRSPAILLFHGGGWSVGSAEWTFDAARRFAGWGMVAIAIEYRLSQENVTPIEALADTCAAFRWVRQHAKEFNVNPNRVAGYGISAGGHLVAAAATVGCPSDPQSTARSRPDALLLWSPALDVTSDGWFNRLLQGRASSRDLSPVEHVGAKTPPTCIVHGEKDTLTPLAGVRRFQDRVIQSGGICEVNVYQGVGHLLTRNLANQESDFDPDPVARADGIARQQRFLISQGFISEETLK